MSGFDVQMRSDAMVQQNRQFYDEQGFQAQRDMVHGLRQSAGMAVEGIQMAQEMAMRQADADMRLQLQQQEFQTNAFKLQQMALIDQTDMTRLQVETQREQLKAMQMENERARKALEGLDVNAEKKALNAKVIAAMGGAEEALRANRLQYNAKTGDLKELSEPEFQEALKSLKKSDAYRRDPMDQERNSLSTELQRVQRFMDPQNVAWLRMSAQEKKQVQDVASYLQRRINALVPGMGYEPAPANDTGATNPMAEPTSDAAAQPEEPPHPMWTEPFWSSLAANADTQRAITGGLYVYAQKLAESKDLPPQMAERVAMRMAQERPEVFGFLLKMGGQQGRDITDAELRAVLKSRFPNLDDKGMQRVFESIDRDVKVILRGQK